jgi:hypothetical protein
VFFVQSLPSNTTHAVERGAGFRPSWGLARKTQAQKWLTKPIRIMSGIGTPSSNKIMERIRSSFRKQLNSV